MGSLSPSSAKKNKINSGSSKSYWASPLPRPLYRSSLVPLPNTIPAAEAERAIGEEVMAAATVAATEDKAVTVAEVPEVAVVVTAITAVATAAAVRKSTFRPKAVQVTLRRPGPASPLIARQEQ